MTDKSNKKLTTKPTEGVVKKQIDIPSTPNDIIKDGLKPMEPVSVFKVKPASEIEESKKLIQGEIAKCPELTTLLQWPAKKMAEAFDGFYATRNLTHSVGNHNGSGSDYFREIITQLNTADDYGSGWRDNDEHAAFVMNMRAVIKIHKTTPVADRYTMNADVSELRESIETHRIVNAAIAQYAKISDSFRTNLRDIGYVPLNNSGSYMSSGFSSLSNLYTEKTILATYANLPFFIKKCVDNRKSPFPDNLDFSPNINNEQHYAERVVSEIVGSWRVYSSDIQPTDVRDLPHFKLAYDLQRTFTKNPKEQEGVVEEVIAQFLRAGDGIEEAGLVTEIDHSLISFRFSAANNWGGPDFERTVPKIGMPLYSFTNSAQQMRGKPMTEAEIPRDNLISEIVNYFKYVQALHRSLFTNHDANKRGGFYYARPYGPRFHDTHYVGVSNRTKEKSEIVFGSKRSSADGLIHVLTEQATRMFGRDYIAKPYVDSPYLLEWSSFLVHATRYCDNDDIHAANSRFTGLSSQCNSFRATIESIRSTTSKFNELINDLIIERNFKPYTMLVAAGELHDKIKNACSGIFIANNALLMQLSLVGQLATDWTISSSGYGSTVTRLGGRDPDPIEAFGNHEITYHKLLDGSTLADISGKTSEAIKDMISNVNESIESGKEAKPKDKPEDTAAE